MISKNRFLSKGRKDSTTNKHRKTFPNLAKEVIRVSDIVLEILDARFIEETRNKELENLVKNSGKILIYVLNKADLISINELKNNVELEPLKPYIFFSSKKGIGKGKLRDIIKIYAKKVPPGRERVQVGIIGYPNTGKSSLINFLSGKGSAGVSAESGYTKGIQKIRLARNIVVLDTPGVIPEQENSCKNIIDLHKHAMIGVRTYDKIKEPDFILAALMEKHPEIAQFYGINTKDSEFFLDELGKRKGFLRKGGLVDFDRTARHVLKDWQEGKFNYLKTNEDI